MTKDERRMFMKLKCPKFIFFILFALAITIIPNTVFATEQTVIDFDYSQIRALDGGTPKLYELDAQYGEILSEDWLDSEGNSILNTASRFIIGEKYTYKALIRRPANENIFFNIINAPGTYEELSVGITGDQEELIEIIITIKIPKKFKITINVDDGIDISTEKEIEVYEMEEQEINITVEEGYEIAEATANGISILNNDNYFEDTHANLHQNKIRVWNINTDVDIDIKTIELIDKTVNITSNEFKAGVSTEDIEFTLDNDEFEFDGITWLKYKTTIEDGNPTISEEEFNGIFEPGVRYGVEIALFYNGNDGVGNLVATLNGSELNLYINDYNWMLVGQNFEAVESSEDIETYKVTFDANGGTINGKSEYINENYKSDQGFPQPIRAGYYFKGWYTKPVGGIYIVADDQISNGMTLYAHWDKEGTVSIDFANMEYTADAPDIEGKWLDYLEDMEIIIFDSDTNSVKNKDGKVLMTIDAADKMIITNGLTVADNIIHVLTDAEKEDLKQQGKTDIPDRIEVIFSTKQEAKLIFDANGGFFKNNIETIDIEDIINFDYDAFEKPTREGYKFIGFYTEDDKTYLDVMNSEAGVEEDTTFYAEWELDEEVPKTLDNITSSMIMGTISLIGLVGATIYFRKRNKVRA